MSKTRTMRADEVRTGDTIMPPSAKIRSVVAKAVTHAHTRETTFNYTNGSEASMSAQTPVRVLRKSRTENHDAPTVVHASPSITRHTQTVPATVFLAAGE